jgi:hypothetical protein
MGINLGQGGLFHPHKIGRNFIKFFVIWVSFVQPLLKIFLKNLCKIRWHGSFLMLPLGHKTCIPPDLFISPHPWPDWTSGGEGGGWTGGGGLFVTMFCNGPTAFCRLARFCCIQILIPLDIFMAP